jgi:YfiH family protein
MTVLRSALLTREGFENGFGTRRSTNDDHPPEIHILLQVHGERIVVLTKNAEHRTQNTGEDLAGRRESNQTRSSISPSPSRPLSISKAEVVHMTLPENHFRFSEGDAMVTDIPGTAVGIRTADCLPILVGDPASGAVAAIHCGWRSLALGLAGKGVRALIELTGAEPSSLVAAQGPSIGPCCYEVGEEVKNSFPSGEGKGLFETRGKSLYLDLAAGAKSQLLAEGMSPDSIDEITGCTSCDGDMFWSWRARGGEDRMVSYIRAIDR